MEQDRWEIHPSGASVCRQNVQYQIGYDLISYNHMMDIAYRTKNNLSFVSKKPTLSPVRLSFGYYDFLKGMKNDRAAMADNVH